MNIFVYGTLMDQEIMGSVSGDQFKFQKAHLNNYVRKRVRGEVYPAIIGQNNSLVDGILYFDVSAEAVDRLDRFEGSQYVRNEVLVSCDNGELVQAQTYIIAAESVDQLAAENWSFKNFLQTGKAEFKKNYQGFEKLG
ncbi:MAG: gamma-glutamylcyclotransferase family protein [Desulfuromusa sp.]|nr:gamma-glutamylcyclotransferase family protein [Desulfuromusa sp.]